MTSEAGNEIGVPLKGCQTCGKTLIGLIDKAYCDHCHQELLRLAEKAVLAPVAEAFIPICKDCGKMLVGVPQRGIVLGIGGDGATSALPERISYSMAWLCPNTCAHMEPVWVQVLGKPITPGPASQVPPAPPG